MGYRTVVMLNNDLAHAWSKDPELGQKILHAMYGTGIRGEDTVGDYGRVVECTHADVQSLAVLNHYTSYNSLAHNARLSGANTDEDLVNMLALAANKLGYKLVKRRAPSKVKKARTSATDNTTMPVVKL